MRALIATPRQANVLPAYRVPKVVIVHLVWRFTEATKKQIGCAVVWHTAIIGAQSRANKVPDLEQVRDVACDSEPLPLTWAPALRVIRHTGAGQFFI